MTVEQSIIIFSYMLVPVQITAQFRVHDLQYKTTSYSLLVSMKHNMLERMIQFLSVISSNIIMMASFFLHLLLF